MRRTCTLASTERARCHGSGAPPHRVLGPCLRELSADCLAVVLETAGTADGRAKLSAACLAFVFTFPRWAASGPSKTVSGLPSTGCSRPPPGWAVSGLPKAASGLPLPGCGAVAMATKVLPLEPINVCNAWWFCPTRVSTLSVPIHQRRNCCQVSKTFEDCNFPRTVTEHARHSTLKAPIKQG